MKEITKSVLYVIIGIVLFIMGWSLPSGELWIVVKFVIAGIVGFLMGTYFVELGINIFTKKILKRIEDKEC